MRIIRNYFFICILSCVISIPFAAGITSDYEYYLNVTPICTNYTGYVQFDLPENVSAYDNHFTQNEIWFEKKSYSVRTTGWYVIEDSSRKLVDMNQQTSLAFTDTAVLTLRNGKVTAYDTVYIHLEGAKLEQVDIASVLVKSIKEYGNTYEIIISPQESSLLVLQIQAKGEFSIAEAGLYQTHKEAVNHGYIYVDNTCNKPQQVSYGGYGISNKKSGKPFAPFTIPTRIAIGVNTSFDYDIDDDDILNGKDNCLTVPNYNQIDANQNGIGDACEDADQDGIYNSIDNCINTSNTNQADSDSDGVGDACQPKIAVDFSTLQPIVTENIGIISIFAFLFVACIAFLIAQRSMFA